MSSSANELVKRYNNIKFGNPMLYLAGTFSVFVLFNFIYYSISKGAWSRGGVMLDTCVKYGKPKTVYRRGKQERIKNCLQYEKQKHTWPLWVSLLVVNFIAYLLSSSVISLYILILNPDLLRLRIVAWVVGEAVDDVF